MKTFKFIFAFLIISSAIISCNKDNDSPEVVDVNRQFGIFKVLEDDITIEMDGTIDSSSLTDFNKLETAFSDVKKINIKNCGGSFDDEVNLKLSVKVHQKGINIHLMDEGTIASGGVDFFIAGVQRTKGSNTKIGVHSWAGLDSGTMVSATDFPVGHENHLPYINYYVSVGFTQKQAEDFYYFTINAAPADGIHWMTDAEIEKYNLITP